MKGNDGRWRPEDGQSFLAGRFWGSKLYQQVGSPGTSMECPDCGEIVIVIRRCWLEQGRGEPYLPSQPTSSLRWENDLGLDI